MTVTELLESVRRVEVRTNRLVNDTTPHLMFRKIKATSGKLLVCK